MNIPADINARSILDAARTYRDELRWTLHALNGPDDGTENERGKKPIATGWKNRKREDATEAYLSKYFGNGQQRNLGVLVQPPHIVIDLDSKPDGGASVEAWTSARPELAAWPCERTTGGLHLHVICRDVPPTVTEAVGKKQKIEMPLSDAVNGEIFFGGNVVVAPSVHKSGKRYEWLRTGPIPEVSWTEIVRIFSVPSRVATEKKSKKAATAWLTRFKGDVKSLDIVALATACGLEPRPVDADAGKHAIRCPWTDLHTAPPDARSDSSTVIFEARDGGWPAFKCLHASHGDKPLSDFVNWCEDQTPGIVDAYCARSRIWKDGQLSEDGRPRLLLPEAGRPHSEFADDAGVIMAEETEADGLFLRNDLIVEVQPVRVSRHVSSLGFSVLKPVRAITLLEKFAEVGSLSHDEDRQEIFVPRSMNENTSKALLASPQFREHIPVVERILDIPQPILRPDGSIGYPKPGYDPEFRTFLNPHAPSLTTIPLPAAKGLFAKLFSEFCFADEQSLIHALAAIITPFCRGLFGRWNERTPVNLYKANRERSGKDYCAALSSVLYEGRTNEDAPLNSDEPETRKKITSALIAGRRRIHFANCRGYINNAAFEMLATTNTWTDRRLGENSEVTIPNEIEISLSANVGLTYTPDFANRCRVIMLQYDDEYANSRRYQCPDLHGWLMQHRGIFVSALAAFVENWNSAGRPQGPCIFTSYHTWARVVGGIMHAAGLGDPCRAQVEDSAIDGDRQTSDMKTLFAIARESFGEAWVKKEQIYERLQAPDVELFSWLDLAERKAKTSFGLLLRKFVGRVLGDIRLNLNSTASKTQQHTFQFSASHHDDSSDRRRAIFDGVFGGQDGHVGHVAQPSRSEPTSDIQTEEEEKKLEINKSSPKVPNVPVVPITDRAALTAIAARIAGSDQPVALDIETYGKGGAALDPWRGNIRLLTLALAGETPCLLDLQAIGYDLGPLAPALARATLLAHNTKFDALWMLVKCGIRLSTVLDTVTASRLLTNGTFEKNDLASLVERHLKLPMDKSAGNSPWGGLLTPGQLRYAAADVMHLHPLHAALARELGSARLDDVYRLEMELLPHVVDMEARGFPVDRSCLETHLRDARRGSDEATAKLRQLFGNPNLNPASPQQLKDALAAKGITVSGTREDVLLAAQDPTYIPVVLAHRTAAKRASQAEGLIAAIAADDRIHARFEPMGTNTGRFSSHDPNLQNIERGPVRAAFAAPPGHALIVADYSQIELRVAAAIAQEPRMIEAYRKGIDLHRLTAALVLDKQPDAVSKDDRQLAKAVNFGLLYGQSARGLVGYANSAYGVVLTEGRAQQIRDRFFGAYRKLKEWQDRNYSMSRNRTEVRTITGRRQLLSAGEQAQWPRFASSLNTPVQGGSADGIKKAIILLAQRLPPDCGLISTVHDELIVLASSENSQEAKRILEGSMIEAMQSLFPDVPVEVECVVCQNWSEKK